MTRTKIKASTLTGPTTAHKAIFGGLGAVCAAVATVFADGVVEIVECAIATGGVIAVIGAVYGVSNKLD